MAHIQQNHPDNQGILEEYRLHLKLANRSDNTLETYLRVLERFIARTSVPIPDVTSNHVLEWLQENGRYKKETTLATWISILSAFFTYCVSEGYISQSPIRRRWRPRLPEPIPKYLDKEEVARVRMQSEIENLRNQVLFEFLVSSGCRITETLMLDMEDIDLKTRTARVKGKGNKIRTVHFSNRCAILMETYLENIPEESEGIFINQHGKRLTRGGAHMILSGMGKSAELEVPFGPHRLRHTFATTLLSKGAELSFISEELGHSHLQTTRVYARLPKEELVSMYRKYMG
ncbi:tyrosine-type recombinase/integrase [Virgibacillus sediminis]|uniref:Tyrosine-type recombinase/integrase n=1 Tax=Virgibacillus sediminis TaxID=202260 RepID=A0ABV7A3P0_9BACI